MAHFNVLSVWYQMGQDMFRSPMWSIQPTTQEVPSNPQLARHHPLQVQVLRRSTMGQVFMSCNCSARVNVPGLSDTYIRVRDCQKQFFYWS